MIKAQLIDTHCHIHDSEFQKKYDQSPDELINEAVKVGVGQFICVGTDVRSSIEALSFTQSRENCFASVALHPHEAAERSTEQVLDEVRVLSKLVDENLGKQIVAIGECGLDYYYHQSQEVKERQKILLRAHIELALLHNLPLIFHIRNDQKQDETVLGQAFEDFFSVLDEYENVRGVVHSFTSGLEELNGVLERGLLVGFNGIITFAKQTSLIEAVKRAPKEKIVLETDAPFLTPEPFRGKICKPKHVSVTASYLSELRGESLEEITLMTTANAKQLFGI